MDEDAFPGALRVTGTYTIEGEKVMVKAFLRRDGQTVATLPVIEGSRGQVGGLLDRLLAAVPATQGRLPL